MSLADALKRLHNLPRDLEAAYEDLLLQLVVKLEPDELDLSRKFFSFVITSQRPLSLHELQHLLCADAMSTCACDSHSVDDHVILQLNRRISELCGDLIHVINNRLQLVHFSVQEFLVRPENRWSRHRRSRKIIPFRVTLEEAHRWFGAACIEYIQISGYTFPLHDQGKSSKLAEFPFLRYSSTYMMTHVSHSGLPSSSLIEKIDKFMNSDQWIAWLELSLINAIGEESLDFLEEEFRKFASWLGGNTEELLQRAYTNLKVTMEKRADESGQDDPHTERLRLLLIVIDDLLSPGNAVIKRSCAVRSTSSSTNILRMLQIVRQTSPLSPHLQADLLLRIQAYLLKIRQLTGPLEIIFRLILQKASTMPIYVLLVVGQFYTKVNKPEQALEIYFAALRKVSQEESRVKYLTRHLIGITYFDLDQYERALEQFQPCFEWCVKMWGPAHLITLNHLLWLATLHQKLHLYEDALGYFQKALAGCMKILGPEHVWTLETLSAIDDVLGHLNQYEHDKQ